jgi:hypothetical protein
MTVELEEVDELKIRLNNNKLKTHEFKENGTIVSPYHRKNDGYNKIKSPFIRTSSRYKPRQMGKTP